jgi:mRNA interferase RelE/StbE
MYKLVFSNPARWELKSISLSHKKAVISALEDIKTDPFIGKPLQRDLTGFFSFQVGVYRILYVVHKKDRTITIISAGHRSTIYD